MTVQAIIKFVPLSGLFATLGNAARGLSERIASASDAMRCANEAERLFQLSDDELARMGLTRDRIVQHAFARYMTS